VSRDFIVASDKSLVSVDVLVDDNIDTVNAFPGEALLVTRSYNRDKFTTRKRVANLAAVPRALVCLYGIHVPVTGIPIGTI
jgi:5'' nucleotidase, deoxy (Pyrimidine), cytosolic type C protein (NT5C).